MRVYYLLGLLLAFFMTVANARAEAVQKLVELLAPIHSLQGNFVQTMVDNKGAAMQRAAGSLALQRPGQFRWEIFEPTAQLIIANHSRLWIYDADLQQVVIRRLAQAAGQTPAFLLSNVVTALHKDFVIRSLSAPRWWQWFSLTPRNKESMYKVIQLGFLNQELKEMRLEDNLGHSTVIVFQHLQKNLPIAASLFQFHPPANVDVIDETH
jgi:outer membrane lipoprotein carrier protein